MNKLKLHVRFFSAAMLALGLFMVQGAGDAQAQKAQLQDPLRGLSELVLWPADLEKNPYNNRCGIDGRQITAALKNGLSQTGIQISYGPTERPFNEGVIGAHLFPVVWTEIVNTSCVTWIGIKIQNKEYMPASNDIDYRLVTIEYWYDGYMVIDSVQRLSEEVYAGFTDLTMEFSRAWVKAQK